jgi:hypothetical protein
VCVMRWCYYSRVRGRCGCCRVHHRPLLRSLSAPTGPFSAVVCSCPLAPYELRESTTKYNKIHTHQWEQKTKHGKYRDLPTQL